MIAIVLMKNPLFPELLCTCKEKGIKELQADNSGTLWCQKGALKGNELVAHSQCFESTEAAEMKVSCRRLLGVKDKMCKKIFFLKKIQDRTKRPNDPLCMKSVPAMGEN